MSFPSFWERDASLELSIIADVVSTTGTEFDESSPKRNEWAQYRFRLSILILANQTHSSLMGNGAESNPFL